MRVAFFAFSRSSLGHVTRMRVAARRFLDAGHDVVVAAHSEVREVIESRGIPWRGIDEIPPALQWRRITNDEELREFARMRLASPEYVERSLRDELAVIDELQPDAVVSDMRNTASVAAAMRSVPSFTCHNLRLFDHPMHVIVPEVIETLRQLGVEEPIRRRVLGDALLVPDVGTLDTLRGLRPEVAAMLTSLVDEIRHIGPLVPLEALPQKPPANGRRPVVLVSLGGSGAGDEDVRKVATAAADLDVRLRVIVGVRGATIHDLGDAEVVDFSEDMTGEMAGADVIVAHGGHSSLQEALLVGTPLVLLPHAPEQAGNAAQVAALGLAGVVRESDGVATLTAALRDALAPARARRSRQFAGALRDASGADEMLGFVESRALLLKHR